MSRLKSASVSPRGRVLATESLLPPRTDEGSVLGGGKTLAGRAGADRAGDRPPHGPGRPGLRDRLERKRPLALDPPAGEEAITSSVWGSPRRPRVVPAADGAVVHSS